MTVTTLAFVVSVALLCAVGQTACSTQDAACMNAAAVGYTNNIRKSAGLPPLQMGTKAMLANAIQHSKAMYSRQNIYHQPVEQGVYVGSGSCNAMISGENVAMNFVSGANDDVASKCCEQWRKSPGHYQNIVANNLNVVIGIYTSPDGKVWCTQTFSNKAAGGGGECAPATGGAGGGSSGGGGWGTGAGGGNKMNQGGMRNNMNQGSGGWGGGGKKMKKQKRRKKSGGKRRRRRNRKNKKAAPPRRQRYFHTHSGIHSHWH